MDDSAIICDKIIDADRDVDAEAKSNDKGKWTDEAKVNNQETKIIPTNFNGKKATRKTQKFYILLAFLLINIELLIVASIYCHLIKYQAKQLLPFHYTNKGSFILIIVL